MKKIIFLALNCADLLLFTKITTSVYFLYVHKIRLVNVGHVLSLGCGHYWIKLGNSYIMSTRDVSGLNLDALGCYTKMFITFEKKIVGIGKNLTVMQRGLQ